MSWIYVDESANGITQAARVPVGTINHRQLTSQRAVKKAFVIRPFHESFPDPLEVSPQFPRSLLNNLHETSAQSIAAVLFVMRLGQHVET